MTARLVDALVTTEALNLVFSDTQVLQVLLDVEAALARAQAALGVIPASAASAIQQAAKADGFDIDALARDARASATIAIPLVAALTARVEAIDPDAARYVHWGATSQDIADTAMSVLIERACHLLKRDHATLAARVRELSDAHADTVMLGRTLLQPAPPITFGLKAAGWYGSLCRSWARVAQAWHDAARIQLGGASGTLAAFGDRGQEVVDALGDPVPELLTGLPAAGSILMLPPAAAPWHTARDRYAALVSACAIYGGVLGKMARDVSLLMQFEVGEVREAGGGSSTLPHKQNPSGCARTLAAAARLPGLAATMLAAIVQEHERAVGAWQAEWPVITETLQAAGAALEAMRAVMDGLTVDAERMRANIDATRGAVFAERVMLLATPALGRARARELVEDALARAQADDRSFTDVVRSHAELARVVPEADLRSLDDPRAYLGAAEALRKRLFAAADAAAANPR
jgi:3-carboxy-cis,cis-muconate cycloisomerase